MRLQGKCCTLNNDSELLKMSSGYSQKQIMKNRISSFCHFLHIQVTIECTSSKLELWHGSVG